MLIRLIILLFILPISAHSTSVPLRAKLGARLMTSLRSTASLEAQFTRVNADLTSAHRELFTTSGLNGPAILARVHRLADQGRRLLIEILRRREVRWDLVLIEGRQREYPVIMARARDLLTPESIARLSSIDQDVLGSLRFGYAPDHLIARNNRGMFYPRLGLVLGSFEGARVSLDPIMMHEIAHYLLHYLEYFGKNHPLDGYLDVGPDFHLFYKTSLRDDAFLSCSEILAYAISNLEEARRATGPDFRKEVLASARFFTEIEAEMAEHLERARGVLAQPERWRARVTRFVLAGHPEVRYRIFIGLGAVYLPIPPDLANAYLTEADRTDETERDLSPASRQRLLTERSALIRQILTERLDTLGPVMDSGLRYFRTLEDHDGRLNPEWVAAHTLEFLSSKLMMGHCADLLGPTKSTVEPAPRLVEYTDSI